VNANPVRNGSKAQANGATKLNNAELQHFTEVVSNVLASRQEFLSRFFDPRRNLDDECGYPSESSYINPEQYQVLYEREPIAARVVEMYPSYCWQFQPEIYELEDTSEKTQFEQDLDMISAQLRPEFSYYTGEQGSALVEYMRRIDVLSGIGCYGGLLLGINDGRTLDQPVEGFPDEGVSTLNPNLIATSGGQYFSVNQLPEPPKRRLLYLKAFPEYMCKVQEYEASPSSMRFGMPKRYSINLFDPRDQAVGGFPAPSSTINVHWHRIVHIADNLSSSEVFGVPRMRPVLNRLLDLRKLYASSAEMYYKGAFPGLSIETHPQLGGDVQINVEATEDMMENYMNGLQRFLALIGMSAKSLAPMVVDPTPQIMVQIGAVCVKMGAPIRIFMGSERGELASSQDEADWDDKVRGRQRQYLTPRLIVPVIDRFISLGIVARPKAGFSVFWPDLSSQTDQEKATVAFKRTQALAQYLTSRAMEIMSPEDFLSRVLGYTEKEATAIVGRARASTLRSEIVLPKDNSRLQSDTSTASSGSAE